MSNTHVVRFVRALALGAVTGSITIAACSSSSPGSDTTGHTSASSGNESAAQPHDAGADQTRDAGAAASLPPGEYATPDTACSLVGQVGSTASRPPLLCTCTARDAGPPTWDCSSMGEIVTGPLPPPDMPA